MRLNINKEQFLKALLSADKAIAPKNPNAVLASLKLDLNEKGLEIIGSNSNVTIKSTVPYMIGEKNIITNSIVGSTLVNAHLLTEIVRRMEGEIVGFDVIDKSIAKIDDGRSSFKLNCTPADEYPDIDLEPSGTVFTMPCSTLTELVEQSAFAASTKEQRFILTALNLEVGDNKLVATATDSARLSRKSVDLDTDVSFKCNIPAKALLDIVHMFESARTVEIAISDRKALFSFEGTVVSSCLVPGDYPVTKSIIPQNFNYFLEVNAQELLSAMGRVSVLASDRESVIKLSMSEDSVEVSVKSQENGSANEHIQTFQYTGERLEVSFNSLFVVDAIKALKSEDVTICFQAEMKPFVVKNGKDDSVVELITPMRTY